MHRAHVCPRLEIEEELILCLSLAPPKSARVAIPCFQRMHSSAAHADGSSSQQRRACHPLVTMISPKWGDKTRLAAFRQRPSRAMAPTERPPSQQILVCMLRPLQRSPKEGEP